MADNLTLLIDADVVAYTAAAGGQKAYDFGDTGVALALDPLEDVVDSAHAKIRDIRSKFGKPDIVLCFTDSDGNFRKKLLPTYKGTRKEKPVHLMPLREELSKHYTTYLKPTLEGDDVMGILATHPTLIKGEKVIVSIDKDMRQIPGRLYNPDKDHEIWVTQLDGDYWHMTQTLTGDPVDEYDGLRGVGKVKAAKILGSNYGEGLAVWWARVRAAYYDKLCVTDMSLTAIDDAALVQARCAKILQYTDYDFKRKEVKLWQPPKA